MVESSLSLQLVDVGTAANVLLVHGTSLGQDNGWELHVPSEVCLLCTYILYVVSTSAPRPQQ